MNIEDVMKLFKLYPKDTEVLGYDSEVSYPVPITGMLYDSEAKTLELTTDDPC